MQTGSEPRGTIHVVVVGAGGHGRELSSYVEDVISGQGGIEFFGFIDESKPRTAGSGGSVLGNLADLAAMLTRDRTHRIHYITAVGDNRVRRELVGRLAGLGCPNLVPWTLVHPRADRGRSVDIGEGSCVAPGVVLTTCVGVGKHCIVNVNASISHDSIVGDFCNINPGVVIAGNVHVGAGCFVGANATVIEKVTIGEGAVVGAGAVVIDDIPAHVTAVGVPARVIRRHTAETAHASAE